MPAKKEYNWIEIQKAYDSGDSWRVLTQKFGVHAPTISNAIKTGQFVSRNPKEAQSGRESRPHTELTKQKISAIRRKFIFENPDKVPYKLNHSSKRSWLEITTENALIDYGLKGFETEYQNGPYSYDFAWSDVKLDLEVDGKTHLQPKVQLIDKRRDEWSKSQGWTVLRFSWLDIRNNLTQTMEIVKVALDRLHQ